jgi:LTXXQ motif family protein
MSDRAPTRRDRIQLRTQDRQDKVQQRAARQPDATRKTAQDRREQLQQKLKQGDLNRGERRQIRALARQEQNVQRTQQREERRLKNTEQRLNRLQAAQERGGRLNRSQQRELLQLQRAQQREGLQARERQPGARQAIAPDQRAGRGTQRVTQQQAQAGRFAAQFQGARQDERAERRANRQGLRISARAAWQRGAYASYVPWLGAVYWPYAYTDVFHYTFWPYAYEPSYWAHAYDDFFDGVFFPDGAPYIEYANGSYEGPYARTGSVQSREPPGHVTQAARQVCAEPDKGVTAWPFERIVQAVQLADDQKALLEDLKRAADKAAEGFKRACPESLPLTPPGRLKAMTIRLRATLDAVKQVRPPLEKFYESLSDEQKARFNEIGPELGRDQERTARNVPRQKPQQGDCGGAKSGLSSLAIERIEERVAPTEAQFGALDRLNGAVNKAVETLQSACPTSIPLTPVGRLEVMQQRLEAMIEVTNTVRPALEDFYASLGNEQKAKFNRLGLQTAQSSN